MKVSEIIKIVKDVQKDNPYPADVFTQPTHEDYQRFNKHVKEGGFCVDAYNGTMGRTTWDLCCSEIIKRIEYDQEEK